MHNLVELISIHSTKLMSDQNFLTIRQAAEFLGVSVDTLRRWDQSGKLVALRAGNKGTHRFYLKSDLELFLKNIFALAKNWVLSKQPFEPETEFYCQSSAVFQTRLAVLESVLQNTKELEAVYPLIIAVTGELGNNSFDHNLGSWPDIPGIFFAYDTIKKVIVLADRGQGILQTLKRVKPELRDHATALKVAFTEIITGRAPEKRGNGLKFVKKVIAQSPINLIFQTGNAILELKADSETINIRKSSDEISGCLALVRF